MLRLACRLALAAACIALAALWIDASWHSQTRTLELRVRRGREVLKVAQSLAGRARSEKRERKLPAVSKGEPSEREGDELTDEDRRLLQRLIEEKLRK